MPNDNLTRDERLRRALVLLRDAEELIGVYVVEGGSGDSGMVETSGFLILTIEAARRALGTTGNLDKLEQDLRRAGFD